MLPRLLGRQDIARYKKHVDALEEQLKASGYRSPSTSAHITPVVCSVEPQLMIEESRSEPQPPSPTPGTPSEVRVALCCDS